MEKRNKIINILLMLVILIQPILEFIYFDNSFLFGFKIATIIRIILFGILSVFILLKYKELKYKKVFIVYLICITIYFITHHLNALNFTSYNINNFNYTILEELNYMLRLLIPVFLIYYTINVDLKNNNLKKASIISISVISLVIIISNIFKFSLCSYGYGLIKGNIFDWFINKGINNYLELASRGLFNSVIIYYLVILLSPFIIYLFIKNDNKKLNIVYAILIFVSLICAFMVGTKATTLGYIIILILNLLLKLFFSTIKKENKFSLSKTIFLLLLIILSFVIIPYSPMSNRNSIDSDLAQDKQLIEEENKKLISNIEYSSIEPFLDEETKNLIKNKNEKIEINYLLEIIDDENLRKTILTYIISLHYNYYYGLTTKFIESSYPYTMDPYFWKDFVDNTKLFERSDNRMVIQKIYERVLEINNNPFDRLLGLTYSRTSKIFNLERDFLYQSYSMGIIGMLLLIGPYILVITLSGIKILRYYKEKFTLKNCLLLLGIGLTLCLALYSGNTLDNLAITMPLGIMCGYLLKCIKE